MPENRFYINHPLELGSTVTLRDKELHHLSVMRKKISDEIEIVNGENQLAKGSILSLSSKKVDVLIESVTLGPPRRRNVILCQPLLEFSRLDLVLQMVTELGISEIWLYSAEKNPKKDCNAHQMDRMQALMIAAMKQCGRLDLPKLIHYRSLEIIPDSPLPSFYGDLSLDAPTFLSSIEKDLIFFVGPPSGFSEKELLLLGQKRALGVRLHEDTLRTETAAIAAISLALAL